VIEMWAAILIAPALMIVALALHRLEATLERRERPREVSPGALPDVPVPRTRGDHRSAPPSGDSGPRAVPTLP
jgi:hypothetical protein